MNGTTLAGVFTISGTDVGASVASTPAGGTLVLADGQVHTVSTTIPITQALTIQCLEGETIKATAAISLFTGSGTVKKFAIKGCVLDGNNVATNAFSVADYNGTTIDWSQGQFSLEASTVKNFAGFAWSLGRSTYTWRLTGNIFTNNNGDFFADRYAEYHIEYNNFWSPAAGANGHLKLVASSVSNVFSNDFERNGSANTGSSILIATPSDGNDGYITIQYNKFGPEGETGAQPKITVNGSATRLATNIKILSNNFNCASGQVAISLLSPIDFSAIDNNAFNTCATWINDAQPLYNGLTGNANTARGNRALNYDTANYQLFANGGRGFSQWNDPVGSMTRNAMSRGHEFEAPEIRNRLVYSEAFDNGANWTNNGLASITCGQADPYGGTGACALTRSASTGDSESISAVINNTGLGDHAIAKLWAKAGTAGSYAVAVWDTTSNLPVDFRTGLHLTSTWQHFSWYFGGLTPGHAFAFYIYPDFDGASGTTVTVFGADVMDFDGPYHKTAGAVYSSTTFGVEFKRGVNGTVFNAGTGFQYQGAAPNGHCLIGNGTNYVDSSSCGGGAATLTTGTSITLTGTLGYAVCTSTCNVTVPVPAAGSQFCVMNDDNVSTVITLAAIGSSAMYENTARTSYGTAGTGTLVSSGAVGDKLCIVGRDATHYLTTTYTGSWTAN